MRGSHRRRRGLARPVADVADRAGSAGTYNVTVDGPHLLVGSTPAIDPQSSVQIHFNLAPVPLGESRAIGSRGLGGEFPLHRTEVDDFVDIL